MTANKYRLGEDLWLSIQGEGRFAGHPSLWARVFGCNLKCPGFPCDTEYSWNPDFKDQTLTYTAQEIVDGWIKLLITPENPTGLFRHPLTDTDVHFIFSGGEPLLAKYQKLIVEVIEALARANVENVPINITVESNGTQPLTPELIDAIEKLHTNDGVMFFSVKMFFSLSPKLQSVSGEVGAVNIQNIIDIASEYYSQIKFVCDESVECEQELDAIVKELQSKKHHFTMFDYWVMPLGTTREDQLQIAGIVEKYQAKGYRIATRNHTYIWSDAKGR